MGFVVGIPIGYPARQRFLVGRPSATNSKQDQGTLGSACVDGLYLRQFLGVLHEPMESN
jgi:hypothetical protein